MLRVRGRSNFVISLNKSKYNTKKTCPNKTLTSTANENTTRFLMKVRLHDDDED
jgi:hypothetical protein